MGIVAKAHTMEGRKRKKGGKGKRGGLDVLGPEALGPWPAMATPLTNTVHKKIAFFFHQPLCSTAANPAP